MTSVWLHTRVTIVCVRRHCLLPLQVFVRARPPENGVPYGDMFQLPAAGGAGGGAGAGEEVVHRKLTIKVHQRFVATTL